VVGVSPVAGTFVEVVVLDEPLLLKVVPAKTGQFGIPKMRMLRNTRDAKDRNDD
jgi:hypothetical protein